MLESKITDEVKIILLKKAITSDEGWKNLAVSIRNSIDPDKSKQECINLLKIIGSEFQSQENIESNVNTSPSDILIQSLETYLQSEEKNPSAEPITDNLIEMTKKMIRMSTDEGWRAMATAINMDPKYKEKCIKALSEIAGKRQLIINQKFANLSDIFIEKLEYNIALIEVTEK